MLCYLSCRSSRATATQHIRTWIVDTQIRSFLLVVVRYSAASIERRRVNVHRIQSTAVEAESDCRCSSATLQVRKSSAAAASVCSSGDDGTTVEWTLDFRATWRVHCNSVVLSLGRYLITIIIIILYSDSKAHNYLGYALVIMSRPHGKL